MAPQYTSVAGAEISRKMADGGEGKYYAALYLPVAAQGPVSQSLLYPPPPLREPLKLTIKLRVDLQRASALIALDADNYGFFTTPWSDADWNKFVDLVTEDAKEWNRKFWLAPPNDFARFDQPGELPGLHWRPNVACDLDVDWHATLNAHTTVTAYNLDKAFLQYLRDQYNKGEASYVSFRAHWQLYSSEMVDEGPLRLHFGATDSAETNYIPQTVVAHEVGHLLGLDPIGVIMDTNLCRLARILAGTPFGDSPMLIGGTNAQYCYGIDDRIDLASNIMGVGDDYTVDDASPWTYAISRLLGMADGRWRAVAQDPGPGTLVPI